MKKRKSIGIIITFAVIVGILFTNAIMLIFSNSAGSNILKKSAKEEVAALTREVSNNVDKRLEMEKLVLETLAHTPMLTEKNYSFAKQVEYMDVEAKRLGYRTFFLIDKNGRARNLNKEAKEFNLAEREYFQEAMKGKTFITDMLKDEVTGKNIIILSTPIYRKGEIVAVLGGVKEGDFISSICQEVEWKQTSRVIIYDSLGNVIGHTDQKNVEESVNIFEMEKQDSDFKAITQFFTEKVRKEGHGVGEYRFKKNDVLAGFSQMEIKDWSVVIAVDKNEVLKLQKTLSMVLLLIAIASTVFVGLLQYFLLIRRLTRSYVGIKTNIEQLAGLDFAAEFPYDYSNRNNELGDIHDSLEHVRAEITNMVKQTASSIDKLTASATDFSKHCNSASLMANDITTTVDEIAQGATDQASDVQDGVIELEEMGQQMERNTNQMSDMVLASDKVDELQNEGNTQLHLLVGSTEENIQISQRIREAIKNTEQSVADIHTAGDTIKSISEQINLLALNAAIEAARAGESGKGFAVVADEIRKLAESSGSSTAKIQESVHTLSQRTQYAVEQIEQSDLIVQKQSENVDIMNQKFQGISEALGALRETIENIFTANQKINEAREKVSSVMTGVAALTEENAASTEEIAASMQEQKEVFTMIAEESEGLLELGADLERIIKEFKIN